MVTTPAPTLTGIFAATAAIGLSVAPTLNTANPDLSTTAGQIIAKELEATGQGYTNISGPDQSKKIEEERKKRRQENALLAIDNIANQQFLDTANRMLITADAISASSAKGQKIADKALTDIQNDPSVSIKDRHEAEALNTQIKYACDRQGHCKIILEDKTNQLNVAQKEADNATGMIDTAVSQIKLVFTQHEVKIAAENYSKATETVSALFDETAKTLVKAQEAHPAESSQYERLQGHLDALNTERKSLKENLARFNEDKINNFENLAQAQKGFTNLKALTQSMEDEGLIAPGSTATLQTAEKHAAGKVAMFAAEQRNYINENIDSADALSKTLEGLQENVAQTEEKITNLNAEQQALADKKSALENAERDLLRASKELSKYDDRTEFLHGGFLGEASFHAKNVASGLSRHDADDHIQDSKGNVVFQQDGAYIAYPGNNPQAEPYLIQNTPENPTEIANIIIASGTKDAQGNAKFFGAETPYGNKFSGNMGFITNLADTLTGGINTTSILKDLTTSTASITESLAQQKQYITNTQEQLKQAKAELKEQEAHLQEQREIIKSQEAELEAFQQARNEPVPTRTHNCDAPAQQELTTATAAPTTPLIKAGL